jgi:hypothetical protein
VRRLHKAKGFVRERFSAFRETEMVDDCVVASSRIVERSGCSGAQLDGCPRGACRCGRQGATSARDEGSDAGSRYLNF